MYTLTSEQMTTALMAVRQQHPLVHNITNYVTMNTTANALLALGASPVMAHAVEEVEEMVVGAGALVLNIGTLSTPWIEAMFRAGRVALAKGIPVVLDPVGAGATHLRTDTARKLIAEIHPTIVRGNASEILALADGDFQARGVDAQHSVGQARAAAGTLARSQGTVVAVTGPEDFVTDGHREARIRNGHALMARITGSGCAATALIGALCAVEPDPFQAATTALTLFGIAGELAAAGTPGPGTFQVRLLDALATLDATQVTHGARYEVGP